MDASEHLVRKFSLSREELIAAFTTPQFYVEMVLVSASLVLAWLVATLIRRRIETELKKHPPKRIDVEFITKPLALLGPLLALLYLSIIRPMAVEYGDGGAWADAFFQLCTAYLVAKCVILVVPSRAVAWFMAVVIMIIGVLDATEFLHSTAEYLNATAFTIGQFHISLLNLVHGIVILVVVFWIAGLLARTLESYLRRSSSLSYNARELTVKFFRIFVYFVALMITLSALGVDLTAFAVFGGALGVGIGLGLQKITSNFVSGITMLLEKSVQIGDLVEVDTITGWVRQLNIRYTLIETADGREVMIPNEQMMSMRVTSWTHSSNTARLDIKVIVSYDSDAQKVRELMLAAAKSHPLCLKDPEPSCFLREFSDYGLHFLLTFWIPDVREGRNGPQSEVMMSILDSFRKAGIVIAEKK